MENKKILKKFLIILLIIFVIFLMHTVRNCIILFKLVSASQEFEEELEETNNISVTAYILGCGEAFSTDQSEDKESAVIIRNDIEDISTILSLMDDTLSKIQFATIASITETELNGQNCYLIELKDEKTWVIKDLGVVIRFMNNSDGSVVDFFYKYDVTKDENISKDSIQENT